MPGRVFAWPLPVPGKTAFSENLTFSGVLFCQAWVWKETPAASRLRAMRRPDSPSPSPEFKNPASQMSGRSGEDASVTKVLNGIGLENRRCAYGETGGRAAMISVS